MLFTGNQCSRKTMFSTATGLAGVATSSLDFVANLTPNNQELDKGGVCGTVGSLSLRVPSDFLINDSMSSLFFII